ncbi:MAG TPA: YraN family protein [Solirubrobacteraceae bacterium]
MSPQSQRQQLGALGERLALEHYERLGYQLVERNHRTTSGEIDLIVHGHDAIVFSEVKTRRAGGLDPLHNLTAAKRRRMRALAARWLAERAQRPRASLLRIDAVAIVVDDRDQLVSLEQFEDVA